MRCDLIIALRALKFDLFMGFPSLPQKKIEMLCEKKKKIRGCKGFGVNDAKERDGVGWFIEVRRCVGLIGMN